MTNENATLPTRLRKEPLVEAVCEIRFKEPKQASAEVVAGLLYSELAPAGAEIQRLPLAEIPGEVRKMDAKLRYGGTLRVIAEGFAVVIGERSVTVARPRPYSGWSSLKSQIARITKVIRRANILGEPERFSLKYLDVLDRDATLPSLAALKASWSWAVTA